jgi:hypothetical protein
MKQQFLTDKTGTFKTYVFADNQEIVPSSASITVYKPGTSTKLIDSALMTVAADGLLSYALTTSHNDVVDDNYKAEISYVFGGTTYYTTLFYDVVTSILHQVISDDDIINELPQIKDKGWRVYGSADSGSTTTIVSTELTRYSDDYFTGGLATNLTNEETRKITDFASSTGTVTTSAFATATSASDKFMLQRSYQKERQRAFEKIEDWLNQTGRKSHLILDPYDLREVHIIASVAEVCKGLMPTDGGIWFELWERYDKRAYAMFKSLNLKYDDSEDGYIAGAEEKRNITRTLGRS